MAIDPNAGLPTDQPQTQQEQQPDQAGAWRSWMANPDNRASLIQFGLALAAPMGYGENTLGHVAGALGQAGEAATRSQESRRKDDLAEAQLATKQAQLEATSARTGTSAANLMLQQEKLAMQQQFGAQSRLKDLMALHEKHLEKIREANVLRPPGQQLPEPSFDAWMAQNPQAVRMYNAGAPGGGAPGQQPPQQYVPGRSYRASTGQMYTFRGGDPGNKANWELAAGGQ